ncbi:hypothetical protein [Micromonospora sp. NBC_01813]|uniref:hypothetical protein n=1 Tax=Micromonospora sp. NBC_01813 TaxID=2975988 RepID=UPI002DD8C398|nr:hypothetical protein [Micromonospora sp. NBC_01813]WSA11037.1 hypothetical protein OG958_09835 [Micromonospora sp. NBC_01813]
MPPPLRNSPTGTRRDGQDDSAGPSDPSGPPADPDPSGPPSGPPSDDPTSIVEDEPALITSRQLLRWVAVVSALVVAVLACWQDPSYAATYAS